MVPLSYYLIVSGVLFTIGVVGVLVRRQAIIIFLSIELMLSAVNLSLVAFSRFNNSLDGQALALLVMAVAAGEAAVGLAIMISLFRNKGTLDIDEINLLKG